MDFDLLDSLSEPCFGICTVYSFKHLMKNRPCRMKVYVTTVNIGRDIPHVERVLCGQLELTNSSKLCHERDSLSTWAVLWHNVDESAALVSPINCYLPKLRQPVCMSIFLFVREMKLIFQYIILKSDTEDTHIPRMWSARGSTTTGEPTS